MAMEQTPTTPSMFKVSMGFRLFRYAALFFLEGNSNMTKLPIDTHTNGPNARENGSSDVTSRLIKYFSVLNEKGFC